MEKRGGLKIACTYTAVILGAGFASGQEILKYFVGYGISGAIGLALAGVLFALAGWAVLDICHREKIHDYGTLMHHLLGNGLGRAAEMVVAAFLCVLFATMIAAAGATAKQGFNLPFTAGVVAAAALCFAVLLFDLDGVIRLNAILAPFMVVGGVTVGVFTFLNGTVTTFSQVSPVIPGWALAAVVYASYNLVTGIPVLTASSKLSRGKRQNMLGGVLGGAALTLLGLCLALPLYLHYKEVISAEIPLLLVVGGYGNIFTGLYLTVLICAIFTTAASSAFAFIDWFCARIHINRKVLAAVICVFGIVGAHVGFSNMVSYAYPVFGLLGLFEITVILLSWRKAPVAGKKAVEPC
ncbi:MAG: hypothetical protein LBR83_03160 [Clostridiales bacterium]|jgi:uncharacterized membrane protein YkvI|nr:hypothetical protein [Clostridiales bacterium]